MSENENMNNEQACNNTQPNMQPQPKDDFYDKLMKHVQRAAAACIITVTIIMVICGIVVIQSRNRREDVDRRLSNIEESLGIEDEAAESEEDDDLDKVKDSYTEKLESLYQQNIELLNDIREQIVNKETQAYIEPSYIPETGDDAYGLCDELEDTEDTDDYEMDDEYEVGTSVSNESVVIKKAGNFVFKMNGDELILDYGDSTSDPYTVNDSTSYVLTMVTSTGDGPERFESYPVDRDELFGYAENRMENDYIVMQFDRESHMLSKITYFHYTEH